MEEEAAALQSMQSTEEGWQQTASAIAKEAAALYNSKSFTECLALLQQLLSKKENDPKVLLNIALTEFHRDGCTGYDRLLEVLNNLKTRCEDLARAADEQLEGINANANSIPATGPGVSKPATGDSLGYIEEYDSSYPVLNIATIRYHLQQFEKALEVLEPLFANIEPVDEDCAKQICLLLLDVTLALRKPENAAAAIRYMEKSYGLAHGPPTELSGVLQPQSALSNGCALDGKSLTVGINPNPAVMPPFVSSPSADSSVSQNSGEETFEEDALSIGLELDGTRSSRSSVLSARIPPLEKSSPAPADIKLFLHLYKVRFLILARNLKAAKREVKSALNLSKDNLTALLLKAELEYLRGNYPKAMKLLTTCNNLNKEPAIEGMILSNIGCVHQKMGKDDTAAVFYVSALKKYAAMKTKPPAKLWTVSQDKSCSVYYNAGLQKLLSGEPILAAASFLKAAYLYQSKPIFWARLAECCISALEKGLLEDVTLPTKKNLEVSVIGESVWRRLVLPSGSLSPSSQGKDADATSQQQMKSHPLSLPFAKKCLGQVLFLLRTKAASKSDQTSSEVDAREDGAPTPHPVPDTVPPTTTEGKTSVEGVLAAFDAEARKENSLFTAWVLASYAFVELCLNNPKSALLCTDALLQQPDLPRAYSFLGHIYAAEALCLLDRVNEAEAHLTSCVTDWMEPRERKEEATDSGDERFARLTGTQARASLYTNMAAIHAVKGNLEQARMFARQAIAVAPMSAMAVLSMVYIEIAEGRAKEAVERMKTFRHLSVSKLRQGV